MKRLLAALLLALAPMAATPDAVAQEAALAPPSLAAELSVNRVEVTTAFSGSEILVFGATERLIGPEGDEVVVLVIGPETSAIVRQKVSVMGFWVNGAAARFNRVPSYWALASTRPVPAMLDRVERAELRLGLDQLPLVQLGAQGPTFRLALADLQQDAGLWVDRDRPIQVSGGRLFHARLPLPATVAHGIYQVQVMLVRDRRVVARQELRLDVVRTGTAAWIADIAREQPVLYGIACIILAGLAGWIGSVVFRRG
ncbi:TIGR02186 family protein [Falsiroseomonas sp.]|uniref:TIGR02186 family protein n=1 Tax=Falsiroseomonas sp. TaxID=2870721 RepID=UPI0027265EC6|nr:TIGR02186 family protein [Falsiroseomonas sp.]MDO9503578.1 TIGR02186 family protein [Falsiroseomonas sp.]MDP3418556.1 TIGR02186 family protein [Falsiroseomonas sp.]